MFSSCVVINCFMSHVLFLTPLEPLQLNLPLKVVTEEAQGAEVAAPTVGCFWILYPASCLYELASTAGISVSVLEVKQWLSKEVAVSSSLSTVKSSFYLSSSQFCLCCTYRKTKKKQCEIEALGFFPPHPPATPPELLNTVSEELQLLQE